MTAYVNDTTAYPEIFPAGADVVIRATHGEGTDCEFNGRRGRIVRWHECSDAYVLFEKAPRGWPNPAWITAHNLRATGATR